MKPEIRMFDFEVRADQSEAHGHFIYGRPIVYNAATDMGYYTEVIENGALDNTDLRDVRLLVNHNTDMIPMARSRNNNANSTMQLSVVDGEGMDIRADLDTENNTDARSLYSAVGRGDVTGMSFMFTVDEDAWEGLDTEKPIRHIRSIKRVMEVSAVTFPAYEQTILEARGLSEALESAKESLDSARAAVKASEEARARVRLLCKI